MRAYYLSGRFSQHLLWVAALAGVVGLLASRALIALSPVAGVLAALANPRVGQGLLTYLRTGAARRAALLVVFLLLSGLYTSQWAVWRHELFRSLTWLGVPLAFTAAVPLTSGQRRAVGGLFVGGTALVGLVTLGQYLLNPDAANRAIAIGQNMRAATGVFHIAFGTMLAQSFFWALLLRRQVRHAAVRLLLLGAALAAVVVLHVLAYRTGLLVFYVGLLAYALRLLLRRHVALGLGLLLLLGLAPWVAYHTLESVRERVVASVWDVRQYQYERDINRYSLARRLAAVETAAVIIRQHPWLGVGPADAYAAMLDQYSWKHFGLRPENRVDVHNQFLSTLVGGGVVGLALWLALLLGPLFVKTTRRNPYVGFFILTQTTCMLVTDILSLQISLNLFVFQYGFLVVATEARHRRPLAPASPAPAA